MSADFEPVRLGPSRRRFDPVLIGVVAVVVALGVAVVKPWESGSDGSVPAPSAVAVTRPAATDVPPPLPSPPPGDVRLVVAHAPSWSEIEPIVTRHDAWGVRAIVADQHGAAAIQGTGAQLSERWVPTVDAGDGLEIAYMESDERPIAVFGVTAPRAEMAEDARVWRVHRGGQLEWVDAEPILSGAVDGGLLYVRPGHDGAQYRGWESGRYRIDVLLGDSVRRLEVVVLDQSGNVPPLDEMPRTPIPAVGAVATDPSDLLPGAFATTDGVAVSLDTDGYRRLGEFETWHDMVWYGGPHVASVFLPRASGLGVMLSPGSFIQSASIARIVPAVRGFASPSADAGVTDHLPRASYVVFPAPDGGTWRPGVYAISVSWAGEGGRGDRTWHVELRPGQG